MNDDPCEPSVEEVLRIVRETPDEETRIRLLHAELLRLDPARADRLMQKYLRRRQRKAARGGTVRRDGGVPLRVWLAAAILCGLLWLAWRHFG